MEMTIPAKSTGDLLQDLKNSAQIADYLQGNKDALLQDSFTDELNRLYKTQGRNKSEIAREAGAERLVLTHFSTSLDEPEAGLHAAEAVFPGTVAGTDGMTIRLKYPAGREPASLEIGRIEDW